MPHKVIVFIQFVRINRNGKSRMIIWVVNRYAFYVDSLFWFKILLLMYTSGHFAAQMEQCTSRGVQSRLRRKLPLHHLLPVALPPQTQPERQVFDTIFWWTLSVLHQRRSYISSWDVHFFVSWGGSRATSCWRSTIPSCKKSRYDNCLNRNTLFGLLIREGKGRRKG